ncbi:9328_t:CDS:2, partial [Dentiscutata erythropus]
MRISKYTSVPSKDIDDEHNESALSEPDSYETMENEEREIMLSKEKGEDDTVVDMGENWEGRGYSKNNTNERSILPCLIIAAVFIIAWVGSTIIYAYYRSTTIGTTSTLNRIQFDEVYNGGFYPQYTSLKWSSAGDDDGVFIYQDDDNIILEQISDRSKKTLVKSTDIIDVYLLERKDKELLSLAEKNKKELLSLTENKNKELNKANNLAENRAQGLLQTEHMVNVRGALEFVRAQILSKDMSIVFTEPVDKALMHLSQDEDFIKILKKA